MTREKRLFSPEMAVLPLKLTQDFGSILLPTKALCPTLISEEKCSDNSDVPSPQKEHLGGTWPCFEWPFYNFMLVTLSNSQLNLHGERVYGDLLVERTEMLGNILSCQYINHYRPSLESLLSLKQNQQDSAALRTCMYVKGKDLNW